MGLNVPYGYGTLVHSSLVNRFINPIYTCCKFAHATYLRIWGTFGYFGRNLKRVLFKGMFKTKTQGAQKNAVLNENDSFLHKRLLFKYMLFEGNCSELFEKKHF